MQPADPNFHHVNLVVSKISTMPTIRNPQQNLPAVVHVRLTPEQAQELLEVLRERLASYQPGADLITFSLEGEFT